MRTLRTFSTFLRISWRWLHTLLTLIRLHTFFKHQFETSWPIYICSLLCAIIHILSNPSYILMKVLYIHSLTYENPTYILKMTTFLVNFNKVTYIFKHPFETSWPIYIYIYTIDTQDKVICNENRNYVMIQNKEEG